MLVKIKLIIKTNQKTIHY